jgi:transposase
VSSIKRWKKAFQQGGLAALASKRHPGPKSKLSMPQKHRLREILLRGPLAAGFHTDLWTCARVAEVVEREFGVAYHPDHLGRILHDLGFSPQKPQRRARERDEAAIERWRREDWPRIKKGDDAVKLPSSFSMKRASSCSR